MISFPIGDYQFNLRAVAVVIDDGAVLLHKAESDDFWALPGGRVEAGESAAATVVRELGEEVSENAECGEALLVVENFFSYQGRRHHEVGLYFRAHLAKNSLLLDQTRSHWSHEPEVRLEYRWFPLAALASVDLRPRFLRNYLPGVLEGFRHVVHRDAP